MKSEVAAYFSKDNRNFEVRFFDCEDSRDLRDLVVIVESPGVQRWMDNVENLTFDSYTRWMDEKGETGSYLYAIADSPDSNLADNRVHGFVYVYPSKDHKGYFEVSYAKRPDAPAGLTPMAIEKALGLVRDDLMERKPWLAQNFKVMAEIERGNEPSIRVIEKAGFKMVRDFDVKNNGLWVRDVSMIVPQEPIRFEQLGRAKQLNTSYCGPATLQILLSHFGIEANQEQLVGAAVPRELAIKNGLSIELLAKAVNILYPEMSFWVKREGSLDDLERMVREFNYPVGVDWQGVFEEGTIDDYPRSDEVEEDDEFSMTKGDDGHYCVVIDVDRASNKIRMRDPFGRYAEKDRYFEIHEFLDRWWDDRTDTLPDGSKKYVYEKRLMFVIVPREVRVPEELGMTVI